MKLHKWAFSFILILILSIGIINLLKYQKNTQVSLAHPVNLHKTKLQMLNHKNFITKAVIGGIGDILVHDRVYEDARIKTGFDFNPVFEPVYDLLHKPDFLIANQESVPGGDEIGLSTYPNFNSPYEIVDALKNAGIDMVTNANNHTLDKGKKGVLNAISYYEKIGMPYTGMFKSVEDKDTLRIIPVNGINIAVLSYATHTNGIPIPKGKEYLINMLEPAKVISDIELAKEKADLILLALHWGDEYANKPNTIQKKLAHQFIHAGADIIFGHHPHVLQPIEWIEKEDGTDGLVIYSLGNFMTGQITENHYKDIGALVEVAVKKEIKKNEKTITIESATIHPTFTSNINFKKYRVYPLDEANRRGFTHETSSNITEFMRSINNK